MAGKKFNKDSDFKYNIDSYIGSIKESDKHDWCKAVLMMTWGENPPSLDIRNVNMAQHRIGKGISLSDEEVDRLVDILVENDYGSLETLRQAVAKREQIYSVSSEIDNMLDDTLVIDIPT